MLAKQYTEIDGVPPGDDTVESAQHSSLLEILSRFITSLSY